MKSSVLLVLICCIFCCLAKNYDFIIAGGSASGVTLAYRLTENPSVSVLLLERGSNLCEQFSDTVGFYGSFTTTPQSELPDILERSIYDRHFFTREINTQSVYVPLPTMLGGGALRNGNAFGRMSVEELAGFNSPLWTFNATNQDWKDLLTYRKCLTGNCNTFAHGTTGPLQYDTFELDNILELVADAYASQFNLTWNDDSNDGSILGLSVMHRNIKVENGFPFRQEPYCNLLDGVINSRPNLEVLSEAVVTRVDLRSNGKNRVEYFYNGQSYSDVALNEVLITAGALESPQLLKLSGIGPCTELENLGIECIHENPLVGENLIDNPTLGLTYITPAPLEASPGSILVGYFKTDPNQPLADFEIAATSLVVPTEFGLLNGILTYTSDFEHGGIGRVLLRSKNPLEDPVVSSNFYTVFPQNVARIREVTKKIRTGLQNINNAFGFSYFTPADPSLDTLPINATDQELDAYILGSEGFAASWHYTGSTAMHDVVDDRLRVIDKEGNIVPGLRVIGNGVVPNTLKSHSTSSCSMFLGQVASRLIKEDYGI